MIVIAGLSGSFRKNSYNTAVLKAASKMLPGNIKLELLDISKLPMFNEDLEGDELPNPVVEFKNQLSKSNALLISSPEYNYSIPPVLKKRIGLGVTRKYPAVIREACRNHQCFAKFTWWSKSAISYKAGLRSTEHESGKQA